MSLIRTVLRRAVVAALRQKTWAQNRVYDSDNDPLVDALKTGDRARPYIVVYTDNDNYVQNTMEHGIYSSSRSLQLVLEIGVASAVEATIGEKQIVMAATDASMEMTLDFVQMQALAAIHGDPRSEWGELCRDIFLKLERINSQRGGRAEKGGRWAARQIVIIGDTISDPAPGVVLGNTHPIKRFIELSKADDDEGIRDAALLIEDMLVNDAYPEWEQAQAWLGLTKRGIRATGQAPLADTPEDNATPWATEVGEAVTQPDGEPPPLEQVDLVVPGPEPAFEMWEGGTRPVSHPTDDQVEIVPESDPSEPSDPPPEDINWPYPPPYPRP